MRPGKPGCLTDLRLTHGPLARPLPTPHWATGCVRASYPVWKARNGAFLARMNRCYRERLEDIVLLAAPGHGDRFAAEWTVHGEYLVADDGLPPADGQRYVLPGGAFFTVRDGRIARVTNFYNLADWLEQVK